METVYTIREEVAAAIARQDIAHLIGDHRFHLELQSQLYLTGFSLRKIANLFATNGVAITHETVRKNLIDNGIPIKSVGSGKKPFIYRKVADRVAQIEQLLKEGLSNRAIAKKLGLNIKSVSRAKKLISSI